MWREEGDLAEVRPELQDLYGSTLSPLLEGKNDRCLSFSRVDDQVNTA